MEKFTTKLLASFSGNFTKKCEFLTTQWYIKVKQLRASKIDIYKRKLKFTNGNLQLEVVSWHISYTANAAFFLLIKLYNEFEVC